MKFSTKKQSISISYGQPGEWMDRKDIMGYVSSNGIWAIHKGISLYNKHLFTLCHLPSGYNISRHFKTKKQCEIAARILHPLADWKRAVRKNRKGFYYVTKNVREKSKQKLQKKFGNIGRIDRD